jgi:hypothetical protein
MWRRQWNVDRDEDAFARGNLFRKFVQQLQSEPGNPRDGNDLDKRELHNQRDSFRKFGLL